MKEGPIADCQETRPLITAKANAAVVALERFGLQSKACVVTGGTKGIGAAIVFELASLKAKVSNMHVRRTMHRAKSNCDRVYSPTAVHMLLSPRF